MRLVIIVILALFVSACVEVIPSEFDPTIDEDEAVKSDDVPGEPEPEPSADARLIELSQFATIHDGPIQLVHDRRASGGLAVIAPWKHETFGGSYPSSETLDFSFARPSGEVSVWVRMYSQRANTAGWQLDLDGVRRTIKPDMVHTYEWVEAYRGTLSGTTASLRPLGSRSSVDTVLITPSRDSSGFDELLDLPIPGPVPDARYFVSMSGSDSASGSMHSPFRTIQKAIDAAQPGDIILVREGTYAGFRIIQKSGRADARITVQAYPGERVILDAHLTNHEGGVIYISNPSKYWMFDGFEITDTNPRLDEVRALDIGKETDYQRYLELKTELSPDWIYGVRMLSSTTRDHSSHLTFQNFEIRHMPRHGFSGNGRHIHYLNNHVHDIGYPRSGYAWYSGGESYVWDGNIVHDTVRAIQARVLREPYPVDMAIENNLFYRNGRHIWEHSSNSLKGPAIVTVIIGTDSFGSNNAAYNNIFLYNGNGYQDQTPNGRIAHNSFIGNGLSSSHYALNPRRDGMVVTNNVFFDNRRNVIDDGSGTVLTSNIETSGGVYRDPYKLDFTVVPDSPTINAGVDMRGVVDVDFSGTSRPQNGGWDAGAIER